MQFDRDFREFLECLAGRDVRYLVVGGYAVAAHGHPRYTGDLDLWVWTAAENAESLLTALDDFGFGSVGLVANDFTEPGRVVQLGYPPVRIDLLTSIDGVEFAMVASTFRNGCRRSSAQPHPTSGRPRACPVGRQRSAPHGRPRGDAWMKG